MMKWLIMEGTNEVPTLKNVTCFHSAKKRKRREKSMAASQKFSFFYLSKMQVNYWETRFNFSLNISTEQKEVYVCIAKCFMIILK